MSIENFNAMVDKAMQENDLSSLRAVIEKELLHYDILFALDKENLLDKLTFQGGTALRLCYGGQRFSEDLDFAGGVHFQPLDLKQMKECIESYIGSRYGLEVSVKEPKELLHENDRHGINVDKWQIRIVTSPDRPDIPKQMIKIEVACIPAYSSFPRALISNYDFLPDGYTDTLIMVESLDEIMADKLIALPSCQRYIRYRDLWDLQWLKKQGAKINIEFIKNKIKDYQIDHYQENLDVLIKGLPQIINGPDFKSQMSRFIPRSAQENTLKKEKFYPFLEGEIREMFITVRDIL
jgi:predicted nucleotidyltransferase component of viral defense system